MSQPKLPSRGVTVFVAFLAIAFMGGGILDLMDTIALQRSNDVGR